jgi:DNA-binding NarL/FixJ family response regulator
VPPSRLSALTALVIATTPVVRRGLHAILADAGWLVLDDASDSASRPSVVVWELPPASSAADVASLRDSLDGVPILVLVGAATPDVLGALVSAGARGAVDRDVDESALVQAARAVAEGRTVVNAGTRADGAGSRPPALTRRESQVLSLLCAGSTNREIADALVISDNTVKNHVRRLYEKLHVRSRTEAVVRAARWGLVRIDGTDSLAGRPAPVGQG